MKQYLQVSFDETVEAEIQQVILDFQAKIAELGATVRIGAPRPR